MKIIQFTTAKRDTYPVLKFAEEYFRQIGVELIPLRRGAVDHQIEQTSKVWVEVPDEVDVLAFYAKLAEKFKIEKLFT